MQRMVFVFLVLISLSAVSLGAAEPVGWRTDGTGVYPKANPPTKWSPKENVVWATPIDRRSNAHPVVVGDKVFTCCEPFNLLCLQASDGKIFWERSNSYQDVTTPEQWSEISQELAVANRLRSERDKLLSQIEELKKQFKNKYEQAQKAIEPIQARADELEQELQPLTLAEKFTLPKTQEQYNGYTTATPTSDGRHVWAVFGNRAVVCFDMQGNRRWVHVLPDHPQAMWGHTSSPLLIGNTLVVNIDQTVGLNAETGEQLWRTKYGQTWGSAVEARIGGEHLILLANGRVLRASDGHILTRVAPLANTSPVVHRGAAFYIDVRAEAFDLPNQINDPLDLKERWSSKPTGSQFFASPVVWDGLIYTVSTRQVLSVMDADSGEVIYAKRLNLGRGPVWPSLCLAGEYLYISSRDGTTLVLQAGREYKEVQRNTLEFFISTPVFDGNRMYIRTSDHMYCISES